MISFCLIFLFLGIFQARAYSSVAKMKECPKVSPQNGIELNEVSGTWRLAYMYTEERVHVDEETTCAIAEMMRVNETRMELMLYIDNKKDPYTIDRYMKEFDVTILTPGEWILHTPFHYLEYIQVKVVGSSGGDRLILSFCANSPFDSFGNMFRFGNGESNSDYGGSSKNSVDGETTADIFNSETYGKLLRDLEEFTEKLEDTRRAEEIARLFRGKRETENGDETSLSDSLSRLEMSGKNARHLWTVILSKSNRVSPLEFIENASLLVKYGYEISKGHLIGFGSCKLTI